jgi:AraC family transcriptional regulator
MIVASARDLPIPVTLSISDSLQMRPLLAGHGSRIGATAALWHVLAPGLQEARTELSDINIFSLMVAGDNVLKEFSTDGRRRFKAELDSGSAHWVPAPVSASAKFTDPNYKLLHIYIPTQAVNRLGAQFSDKPDTLQIDQRVHRCDSGLRHLTHSIITELERRDEGLSAVLDALCEQLVIYVLRNWGASAHRDPVRTGRLATWRLKQVEEFALVNLSHRLELQDLAAIAGLSPMHFSRAFKASTGLAPHRWLIEQRVRRAQHLVLASEESLADIALACGFADQSHLTVIFKRSLGVTPARFRDMAGPRKLASDDSRMTQSETNRYQNCRAGSTRKRGLRCG